MKLLWLWFLLGGLGLFGAGGLVVYVIVRPPPQEKPATSPQGTQTPPLTAHKSAPSPSPAPTPKSSSPPEPPEPPHTGNPPDSGNSNPPAGGAPVAAGTKTRVQNPPIDLRAVERALWQTRTANPRNFPAWMKRFENEANAIHFATLRRQNPKADPATLMPQPLRVAPQRKKKMLYLYGYFDKNKEPGYQPQQDQMVFVFQQTRPYHPRQRKLSYALYDASGYYYREPGYTVAVQVNAPLLNFFVVPAWRRTWWRPRFVWYHRPAWWQTGPVSARVSFYFGIYPHYRLYYHRSYHFRFRPWGWGRGVLLYRRGGRYYYRHRWHPGRKHVFGFYRPRWHPGHKRAFGFTRIKHGGHPGRGHWKYKRKYKRHGWGHGRRRWHPGRGRGHDLRRHRRYHRRGRGGYHRRYGGKR